MSAIPAQNSKSNKSKAKVEVETENYLGAMFSTKFVVAYGLYTTTATFDPFEAVKSKMTEADLSLFYEAVVRNLDHNRAASREGVDLHTVVAFHSPVGRGSEPALRTRGRMMVTLKDGVIDPTCPEDYDIVVNDGNMPKGMSCHRWVVGQVSHSGDVAGKKLDPTYGFPLDLTGLMRFFFVYVVNDSNPNGDPAVRGGPPRRTFEGYGEISGPCIKAGLRLYVIKTEQGSCLNSTGGDLDAIQRQFKSSSGAVAGLWDLRVLGGLLTVHPDGKPRGPIQIGPAKTTHTVRIVPTKGRRNGGHIRTREVKKGKVQTETDAE